MDDKTTEWAVPLDAELFILDSARDGQATCGAKRLKNICNCAIGSSVFWLFLYLLFLVGHPEGCADKRN